MAPEIFEARIMAATSDLIGIHCVADDFLMARSGETIEVAERDHDKNLKALLERCRQKSIKLNAKKLNVRRKAISYMGHVMTSLGLRPDPSKIEAIIQMPVPEDQKALQRALGMATYLSRFCPNFSEITAPLRELLCVNNEIRCDVQHTQAFDRLKTRLRRTSPCILFT